ncbi:MAG: hypothetical protein GY694_13465 [Gammaproteobacteria bacterium]|nr:hypothetical protein [Gammaproteobacteria bacterium]
MKTLKSMLIAVVLTSIAFTSTAGSMTQQGAFIYNETAGEYHLHQNNS